MEGDVSVADVALAVAVAAVADADVAALVEGVSTNRFDGRDASVSASASVSAATLLTLSSSPLTEVRDDGERERCALKLSWLATVLIVVSKQMVAEERDGGDGDGAGVVAVVAEPFAAALSVDGARHADELDVDGAAWLP